MFTGVYGTLSGATGSMLRLQVLSNNLANIDNAGFKQERLMFDTKLDQASSQSMKRGIDQRRIKGTFTDFTQGNIRYTGRPLDLAIKGDGFFKVAGDGGFYYTRHGSFLLQPDGAVVTPSGDQLVGQNGPINLPSQEVSITTSGQIIGPNKAQLGAISLYTVPDKQVMLKQGNNLWKLPKGVTEQPAKDATITQGSLEDANVNPIEMTTKLIDCGRNYQSFSRALKAYDRVAEKTNTIGRIG